MKLSFRKGQIVRAGTNAILVTGPGDKKQDYPVFAGVVIMNIKNEDDSYPVGMYSDTWSTLAFKKVQLPLSKIVEQYLIS
jgi:hypothetical protein